jgi:aryl-alcohol dehydrogenase-like predicted oxidoreductase
MISATPCFQAKVILGLWPIAGVTTIGVTSADAVATIATAIELGIDTFDTAYSYGRDGESDRYLARVIKGSSDRYHIISKVGQRYREDGKRIVDGRPETLRSDAEESLSRLGIERFDTLMLHSVDEQVDIRRSAEALQKMQEDGIAKRIGLCNASVQERQLFSSVCDCRAIQCPLNMLQSENLSTVITDAAQTNCDVLVYWTLMKGLLAGKISPEHVFPPGDSRPDYAVFQGEQRARAHRVVNELQNIGRETNRTPAELAVSWTLSQPGVTAALVGARRPDQIREVGAATRLDQATLSRIDQAIEYTNEAGD